MEILSLKTFKAVVDEGGIKGASLALHTVQSNISTRIQKFESELGVKLFQLNGRKLEQTPAGRLLYEYACKILQLEYQAIAAINQNKGAYELRIGTPETFAAVHLPQALKKLRKTSDEISPKLHTATSAELATAVVNNKVDCAFVGGNVTHQHLHSIPIIDEELVIVEPIDKQYAPVLFIREDGCAYRKCALAWQQNMGRSHEETMSMSSLDGVLGCIAAGLGYTVIGKNMVENSRYENSLAVQNISVGQTVLNISLIHRTDNPLIKGIHSLAEVFSAVET